MKTERVSPFIITDHNTKKNHISDHIPCFPKKVHRKRSWLKFDSLKEVPVLIKVTKDFLYGQESYLLVREMFTRLSYGYCELRALGYHNGVLAATCFLFSQRKLRNKGILLYCMQEGFSSTLQQCMLTRTGDGSVGARLGARSCDKDAVIFCIASCGDTGAAYDFGL